VHENKAAELPALDDDFAKRFGREDGTLDTLRDELRNRLEAQKREQRRGLTGALREVDGRTRLCLAGGSRRPRGREPGETSEGLYRASRTRLGAISRAAGEDARKSDAEYRTEAEKRVKGSLIIEAIAKAENVQATNADIEAEVAQLSRQYQQPREAFSRCCARISTRS
jgi:trigger factor